MARGKDKERPPFWRRNRLAILSFALVGALAVAFPFVRDYALSGYGRGGGPERPGQFDPRYEYNVLLQWNENGSKDSFRAIMYPAQLSATDYRPADALTERGSAKWGPFMRKDGRMCFLGKPIVYPRGSDTAVIAPGGTLTFLKLSPKYIEYGEPKECRVWEGLFRVRKRFPDGNGEVLDIHALEKDGLLPAWGKFERRRDPPPPLPGERTGASASTVGDTLDVSYSYSPLLLLVPLLVGLAPWVVTRVRLPLRRVVRRGLCPRCGYDLRATPDRCPECAWEKTGS